MKRVLVTGAAGFIVYHLCNALIDQGVIVSGIDNFNHYYSIQLKQDRTKQLKEKNVDVLNVDLTDLVSLRKVIEDFRPTHVVNLAAQAGVRYSIQNPHTYIQNNIVGFTNLLEILKEYPQIKTLYASSSSVYGDNQKIPFSESDLTDHPKNLYGATKKANELIAYAYHSLYNMQLVGMRFFTVYGPWGRPDMAYYLFSQAILDGHPIDVFEGDNIQRDFTYIDDITKGIIAALDYSLGYQIFNFGNNNPILLNDFISTLEQVLGKKAIKRFLPQAQGDMTITYADLTQSQQLLGYSPKTDLKEGLTNFAQWFVPYHREKKLLQLAL